MFPIPPPSLLLPMSSQWKRPSPLSSPEKLGRGWQLVLTPLPNLVLSPCILLGSNPEGSRRMMMTHAQKSFQERKIVANSVAHCRIAHWSLLQLYISRKSKKKMVSKPGHIDRGRSTSSKFVLRPQSKTALSGVLWFNISAPSPSPIGMYAKFDRGWQKFSLPLLRCNFNYFLHRGTRANLKLSAADRTRAWPHSLKMCFSRLPEHIPLFWYPERSIDR